jgi:3',5'-cyclic AMP phosphodiesterase CpdA
MVSMIAWLSPQPSGVGARRLPTVDPKRLAAMPSPITIAHLSDVHLGPLEGFSPPYWNAKRLLGFANWHATRRRVHLRPVLDRLVADMGRHRPDHVAVTGDLVNLGLPREYEGALAWLEGLGPPERVSVVPGNHDIYTRLRRDRGVARWQDYMSSDAWGSTMVESSGGAFPYLRRVHDIALIGVNSAVPTPPGVATGRVGADQLQALDRLLEALRAFALCRVVLIHHPPLPGLAKRSRALVDAGDLETVLTARGAELVIHGHNHRDLVVWRTLRNRRVPIVGIASGSIGHAHGNEPLARYNLYRLRPADDTWHIEMTGRGLREPEGPVAELERRILTPSAETARQSNELL